MVCLLDNFKRFEISNNFPENRRVGIATHYKCNFRLLRSRIQVGVQLTLFLSYYNKETLTAAGAFVFAHTSQTLADGPVLTHALARLLHQSVDTFRDWLTLLLFRHLKVSPSVISFHTHYNILLVKAWSIPQTLSTTGHSSFLQVVKWTVITDFLHSGKIAKIRCSLLKLSLYITKKMAIVNVL